MNGDYMICNVHTGWEEMWSCRVPFQISLIQNHIISFDFNLANVSADSQLLSPFLLPCYSFIYSESSILLPCSQQQLSSERGLSGECWEALGMVAEIVDVEVRSNRLSLLSVIAFQSHLICESDNTITLNCAIAVPLHIHNIPPYNQMAEQYSTTIDWMAVRWNEWNGMEMKRLCVGLGIIKSKIRFLLTFIVF